jgi:hypothetical protein
MKRTAFLFAAVLMSIVLSASFAEAKNDWRGVIIYFDSSSFMVKSGGSEKTFLLDKDTVISWSTALASRNTGSAVLEICQTVAVDYITEKSNLKAKKVIIVKESDCYK